MSLYTTEIDQEEIKTYVSSYKLAKYNNGWIIEAKLGKITIDLSKLENIDNIQICARRLSGNGKTIINFGETYTINILSKVAQLFNLTGNVSSIEICRPSDSTGEVCIFGLSINYNFCGEDTALSYAWKALIAKCGKYTCLRMVGNRLFASEGAYIEKASIIKNIDTTPPNMYFRDGEKLKFLGACEIVNMVMDNTYVSQSEIMQPYMHRDVPSPILDLPMIPLESLPIIQASPDLTQKTTSVSLASNIAYDSDVVKGLGYSKITNSTTNKNIKSIKSNGKDYLLLRRGASVAIPISSFLPNREYIASVTIKKLNGNGKVNIGISTGEKQPIYSSILAENNFFEKYAALKTGSLPLGENFKLNLAMLDDGLGEVLISRILVIESVPKLNRDSVLKDLEFSREPPLVLNYNYSDKNSIRLSAKRSAIIFAENYTPADILNINSIIEPLTVSSKKWIAKSYPLLSGLKIKDSRYTMRDVSKTEDTPNLVMGALGFLKISDRIFIEEWNTKTQPNEKDIAILRRCNNIITPSIVNSQVLKQLLPESNITCLPKLWPALKVSQHTDEPYFLYFEKNIELTDILIDCWQLNYPKLYVVGSTKGLPFNMQHLSDYLSYQKLLEYFLGSKGVIDLSDNNNYASAIGILAAENNINLITNNLYYLPQNYDNIKFVNSKITGSTIELNKIQVRLIIEEVISKSFEKHTFNDTYFQLFKQNVNNLLGILC